MTEDKNNEPANPKIRLFPVFLGISACVFINIVSYYRNGCIIIGSLGSLTFSLWLFLVLTTIFYELNKHLRFYKIKKIGVLIEQKFLNKIIEVFKKYFNKRKTSTIEEKKENPQEIKTVEIIREQQDGLIEIKRGDVSQPDKESAGLEERVYSILYILSFLGLAFWRISGIFKVMPYVYVEDYQLGIVDAVLLLVFPCAAVLYLKMRKNDDSCPNSCPIEKISGDILTFFSYVSFIYAAVIAASAVLKINIQVILQWVYYAASAYLVVSLAVNILLSMLKGNILSFNYTLFPKITQAKDNVESQTASWKISLKSLYTIRYTLKIFPGLALALIFVLFLSTSMFVVQPHQQAAVYHFGKLNRSSIKNAGLHFKFPWPVDKAEIYDVHRAASMQIGYESSGTTNFLWTQKHDIGEYMLLLGNGNEMAAINLKIMYVISDLYSYIKTCTNAEAVLSAAAYNALMTRTINTTLDSFLSVDRNSLSTSLLNELSAFCKAEGLGFSVVQVIIESIHPPVDIADVYQNVVSASVDKTTAITRAHTYAETKLIGAVKQSKTAVDQARATQYSRTSDAQKEAAVFYAATEAHGISPGSYELTRNLDVYEKIISGHKVYVFSRGAENSMAKFIIGKVNTLNLLDANKGDGNE
jgi:regulator of protease activity HflC (stomatin/prohibitin superfamily)